MQNENTYIFFLVSHQTIFLLKHSPYKVLSTRTTAPLKTEDDVDKYLQQLKKQIMNSINEGNSVMIIK